MEGDLLPVFKQKGGRREKCNAPERLLFLWNLKVYYCTTTYVSTKRTSK